MLKSKLRVVLIALAAILLLGLFSPEITDTDFWWTLQSGHYILQHHRLPVPDPFAFTTAMAQDKYPGEAAVRRFNLTFEWWAQVKFYAVYWLGGFAGVVLFRAFMLTTFCGLAGLVVWKRTGGFYRALAAALACALPMTAFAIDRSYLFTFFFLAAVIAILEYRRWLWVLPVWLLVWANCHGGFFLGWIVLGVYSAEAIYLRWRGRPMADDRKLWIIAAISIAASGVNPNGFAVLWVLPLLRSSFLQSKLLEWAPTPLWPPSSFVALLSGAVTVSVWAWKRLRLVDALLLVVFGVAALVAYRNTFLVAFWAPVVIATYMGAWQVKAQWEKPLAALTAAALALGIGVGVARGDSFQLRVADWRFPAGAADFLLAHQVTGPMFNSYEYGGYLIWRLWPQERVFIDGRALNESVFLDYSAILANRDNALALLDKYGVQTIVTNAFEYSNGALYNIAPALADPNQHVWKLVYSDAQAVIYMRNPPDGVQGLGPMDAVAHLETECGTHIEHRPDETLCARTLGQVFSRLGNPAKARQWLGVYLSSPHGPDPEAEAAYGR
jgi:hypothetical protein